MRKRFINAVLSAVICLAGAFIILPTDTRADSEETYVNGKKNEFGEKSHYEISESKNLKPLILQRSLKKLPLRF